jgi:hypothetical protein
VATYQNNIRLAVPTDLFLFNSRWNLYKYTIKKDFTSGGILRNYNRTRCNIQFHS